MDQTEMAIELLKDFAQRKELYLPNGIDHAFNHNLAMILARKIDIAHSQKLFLKTIEFNRMELPKKRPSGKEEENEPWKSIARQKAAMKLLTLDKEYRERNSFLKVTSSGKSSLSPKPKETTKTPEIAKIKRRAIRFED
jgi:hypothetical protein